MNVVSRVASVALALVGLVAVASLAQGCLALNDYDRFQIGGADAGTDGGSADAGPLDATVDGGDLDGGEVDADISDASLADPRVRFANLSRDTALVDVFWNGASVATRVAYGDATDAISGTAEGDGFVVTIAGERITDVLIAAPDLTLERGREYTLTLYGDQAEPPAGRPLQLLLVDDDASGLDVVRDVRLTVIHVATPVIRGDLFAVTTEGNVRLATDIGFGEVAVLEDLPSLTYTVGFDAGADGIIDLDFDLPRFAPGSYVNLFVAADPDGAVFLLAQTEMADEFRIPSN